MQAYTIPNTDLHIVHPRLSEIAADLAISGPQEKPWAVFVETFDAVERTIEVIEAQILRQFADHAPSLAEVLQVHADALSTRVKATHTLKAITDTLYCALTPGQRECADRLLPAICHELVMPRMPAR
jgi:LTXXQ motif family protein